MEHAADTEQESLEALVSHYSACKSAYYNSTTSLVSDAEFDALERRIRDKCPTHACLQAVGAAVSAGGRTVLLPYWMSSLDKFYPEDTTSLANWMKRLATSECKAGHADAEVMDAHASPKLDGVSGMLVLGGENTPRLLSRGDGRIGSEWTKRLPLIHDGWTYTAAQHVERVVVRGELVIRKVDFEQHGQDYATGRAMVNGLLGATRNLKPELMRYIHFVAYAVYEPIGLSLPEQLELLRAMGMKTVETICDGVRTALRFESEQVATLQKRCSTLFRHWREKCAYETDGVVVHSTRPCAERCCSGNPANAFAYKEVCAEQEGTTTVEGVDWRVSKHGFLKPTVLLRALSVQGVTITKATGFNAKYVVDNAVGPGACVRITRRGDVIPTITAVLRPSTSGKPQLPDRAFEWSDSGVDILLPAQEMAGDPECRARRLALSFQIMGLKQVSDAAAKRLISAGLCEDFLGAMRVTEAEIVKVEGFAALSAAHFVSEIQRGAAAASQAQWIAAGHVFCRSLGTVRQRQVLEVLPLDAPLPADGGRTAVLGLDGFSVITAVRVVACMPAVRAYWKRVQQHCTSATAAPAAAAPTTAAPAAKKVLLTGFRCATLQREIEAAGGAVVSSWSSAVRLVIRRDANYSNRKVENAFAQNITVIARGDGDVVSHMAHC
jgi:DNA ligase (NAD+)